MRVVLADPLSYTRPYDHHLAAALARRGNEVELITSPFSYGEAPEADGYRVNELFLAVSSRLLRRNPRASVRYALKGIEYGPSVWRLLRRIQSLDPDVVHLQWLPHAAIDLRWLRRLAARTPVVLTAHDLGARRAALHPAWTEILSLVRRLVVHSRQGADEAVALGADPRRIAVIRHAVFETPPGHEPAPPSGRTLLFFGLVRSYKGLDVLVRALPSIPRARLIVAGDPVDPIEPVQRLARSLGLGERIEWRLGFLPEREVQELMATATLVVLPYRKLDSSGVLATSLAYGRPVVVTDVGSLGEIVREFAVGRVVPPEDAQALAAACSELLDQPTELARAFSGTRRAARELTWDAAASAHERVYREAIA